MAVSPQDVQAKLDSVISYLQKTTSSYKQMVTKYGSDWTKWPPTSNWYLALSEIKDARAEVGQLQTPTLTANFSWKEV